MLNRKEGNPPHLATFGICYKNNALFRHISAKLPSKNIRSLFIITYKTT